MRTTWLLALALAGCGDDKLTTLEGLYTISTWTVNTAGCDAEGASVAAMRDPVAYLKAESFIGSEFVNFVTCGDEAECLEQARDNDTIHLNAFSFDDGNDAAGWTDRTAFGFMRDVSCESYVIDRALTAPAMDQIRIEVRQLQSATYAPENGECTPEGAEEAGGDQPCAELEVLTATKTGEI